TERDTTIAVTGPGTARVLYDYGALKTPWMPNSDASAAGILEQFPAGPGMLALPQGAAAGNAMRTGLTQRGWEVTHVVACHTVNYPAPAELALMPTQSATMEPPDPPTNDVVVLTAPSPARRCTAIAAQVHAAIAIRPP